MNTRIIHTPAPATTVQVRRRAVHFRGALAWGGLLGTLVAGACSDTLGDGNSVPNVGEGGAAGASGFGGDSSTGGSSMGSGSMGGSATGGTAAAFECDPGAFDDDGDASTPCVKWRDCAAGEYVKAAGTAEKDRECTACTIGRFSTRTNASYCAVWQHCELGQYVRDAGSVTEDQSCAGCTSGTFNTSSVANVCAVWSDCEAGTYVSNAPSSTVDRVCTPCAEGTRTSGPNESVCQPPGACPAGTVQTEPGTESTPPVCATCDVGTYCAGGTTPAAACATGTWDHDAKPATACAPQTTCVAGTHVTHAPSATEDRSCEPCEDGTYMPDENATVCYEHEVCFAGTVEWAAGTRTRDTVCDECEAGNYCAGDTAPAVACGTGDWDHDGNPGTACKAWSTCPDGHDEDGPGSAISDRSCKGDEWTRQLGTERRDAAYAVGEDASGNTYVAGTASGALPGLKSAGGEDGFLRKYDGTGAALWTRQFGTKGSDRVQSLEVDESGSVYVAGFASGALPGGTSSGGIDAFVRKYDGAGKVQWTWQFGTASDDVANSVSVDGSGNVYVAGRTLGTLSGQTNAGVYDAFVRKYDSDGEVQWTRQFEATSYTSAESVSVDGNGNVYVAGFTQLAAPAAEAFVRKYDGAGEVQWTQRFGAGDDCRARGVRADGNGNVYVVGSTYGEASEGLGVFVRKYDGAGVQQWWRPFGADASDGAYAVNVDGSGSVYVAGSTSGTLPGQKRVGSTDAFVRKYDSAGAEQWTRQFGTLNEDRAYAVTGSGRVAGETYGTLAGQTNAGDSDAFVARLEP